MCRIVWILKYRRRTLVGQVVEREWDVVALEVMPDHVHLPAASPPTVRPSDSRWPCPCTPAGD
ncbi:MAG: transposase [Firmicutes bacterium]|nr:transposase [Bacillota bacterium]